MAIFPEKRQEKILITGGAGFIGSNLADALIARGKQVTVIDDLSTGRFENIAHLDGHPNFRFALSSESLLPVTAWRM